MIQDVINGAFELGAGAAVLAHCAKLYEHKSVRGVSLWAVLFFTAWGFWNVYYYPHLGQFWSFVGGIFVMLANCVYVAMLLYYRDGITLLQAWIFIGKWHAGCRPGDEGWSREDQQVYIAIYSARLKVTRALWRVVCLVKDHDYPFLEFRTNALYHCSRCHREMFGRTLDDLRKMPPMSDEDIEDMHRQLALEEVRP